ncbi:hypothetical protein [Brevundimonas sp.]|jgi:hypothetical protein|uniref:hypothetical protein n=1 Tax=Brevundimonas sp. TaxID=1871086 RepID=UPI00391B7FDD
MIVKFILWIVSLAALAASALVALIGVRFDMPLVFAASALGVVFAVITNPLTSRWVGLWGRGGLIAALAAVLTAGAAGISVYAIRDRDAAGVERGREMTAQMQANLTRSAIAATLNARPLPGEVEGAFTPDSPEVTALFEAADALAQAYKATYGDYASGQAGDCFVQVLDNGADTDYSSATAPDADIEGFRRNRGALAFWFAVREQTRPFGDSLEVNQTIGQIRDYPWFSEDNVVYDACIDDLPETLRIPSA